MDLQLLNGRFSKNEVTELLHKMVKVKIDFHEQKIKNSDSEEDIKFREYKIKSLQENYKIFKDSIKDKEFISIASQININ
jgi:hypothetical protein